MCYSGYPGRGFQRARSFLTKEERIELLKEYKQDLENESRGVAERIKELEAVADSIIILSFYLSLYLVFST